MPISLPDDLAPECYPIAWLLGSWRGFGMLGYPGVPEAAFVQELVVDHDGGPYLRSTTTIHLADAEASAPVEREMTGREGASNLVPGQLWSTETSYWRPVASPPKDGQGDGQPRPVRTTAGAPSPDPTELEVLVADPSGHLSVYVGAVQGPRIELATDAVVRTSTAAEVSSATRVYGLVESDLMWAMDLAAFGHELQTYGSGRLTRED
ncbi:FABP family protein [Georgenia halophila]|uniref:Ferric nitrobindin-like protein n=1 Tax=Georgenia halophila TaxID=620889 RepID=A0ABP8KXK5_9MICO